MEVWRLDSDFSEGEVALDAPPNLMQMVTSASAAELYEQYAPRGQFRPWALLEFPDSTTSAYRLMYPTLICASNEQAFLHDVRTGSLVQTVDLNLQTLCSVDLSERHIFVCEYEVLHVFSRESGFEVLRIPAFATVRCNLRVEDPFLVSGDWLVTPLSVSPEVDESPRQKFIDGVFDHTLRHFFLTSRIAQVSRDGRDLVVLSETHRVVFIRDFECICRGETTFERAGHVLDLRPEDICYYLGFEHARVCVATVRIPQATPCDFPSSCLVCRFTDSMFSPSASSLIFRRRLCLCDLPTPPRLYRVRPVAYSSRSVAYILRGRIQGVGRTLCCSGTTKTMKNFHHQQYQ
jgi:hypothetical protein